ncbi:kinesin light chain 4-like [Saccostrea cucullata]|uniref:kinesin light chain 4-like n=1 Tax=Saccostrea cuccullata TaxID=36930 RepID=UPI002ED54DB0
MHYENLILQTMQSLAIFLNMSDNIEKGEPFQQEVLKRRRHVIGTDNHPIIGSIMNNMGVMYERKKDFRKAAEYYRNGLKIKEETNAPLKAFIISETNVARSLLESGQTEEAIVLLENSFKRLDDFPSLFSDAKSLLWEAMGNAFIKVNNFEEAAESFKKAIEY